MSNHNDSNSNQSETDDPKSVDRELLYNDFVVLLARHDQSIRRFIRSMLPSRDGVDDVMQETALECWSKFSTFSPVSADSAVDEFVRWACVIARYKTLSWQRDRSRDRLVFRESVIERLAESSLQSIENAELEKAAVENCLRELGPEHQRLVLSVHASGDSIAKIASETGEQARRLYSKVNQLRKLLLRCVQNRMATEN